jgi:hypothetical protein
MLGGAALVSFALAALVFVAGSAAPEGGGISIVGGFALGLLGAYLLGMMATSLPASATAPPGRRDTIPIPAARDASDAGA